MNIPSNFEMNKYGLFARLVKESDAELIINLRSDPRARFMNHVSTDIHKQKEWIKEYKKREIAGVDYYFIFYRNDSPIGLYRIYNIKKDSFIAGSLIFRSDCDFEIPILATLIGLYFGFEVLNKSVSFGNIHKDNRKAIKFNKLLDSDFIYEDEFEVFLILSKKAYMKVKDKYESIFIR